MYSSAVWLAVAALCACACAQAPYSEYASPPVPPPVYYGDSQRAQSLIDLTQKIETRRNVLARKLKMAREQALELLAELREVQETTIRRIVDTDKKQRERLTVIFEKIKAALNAVGLLEISLAGEVAREKNIQFLDERLAQALNDSVALNRQEDADLAAFAVLLNEVEQQLLQTLSADINEAAGEITSLASSTGSLADLVNTKKCISYTVDVHLKGKNSAVVDIPIAPDVFPPGDVPVVFCSFQGLEFSFGSGTSIPVPPYGQAPGYGGYHSKVPPRTALGVAVLCKAFEDKIQVTVLDLSEAPENKINVGNVLARACTLPAAGSSPKRYPPRPY